MNYYNFIFPHVLLLLIWFNTNAFVEYINIFKFEKIFHVDTFNEKKKEDFELTYISYLRQYHDSFIIRLITCPICIISWCGLPILYKFNFSDYSFSVVSTLLIYYLFVKIMR